MNYSYVSACGKVRHDADSLSHIKHLIRQYSPYTTRFKAKGGYCHLTARPLFKVISLSPHTIGPNFVGVIYQN
jgi:hypothetical protein